MKAPDFLYIHIYLLSLSVRVLQDLQKNSFFRNIHHSKDIYDSGMSAV